jgi:hypothetical protein
VLTLAETLVLHTGSTVVRPYLDGREDRGAKELTDEVEELTQPSGEVTVKDY